MQSFSQPPHPNSAALSLSLTVGLSGTLQNIQRLKAMLDLVVEDGIQAFTRQANEELGIVVDGFVVKSATSLPRAAPLGLEHEFVPDISR